jgi:hypothetical protein
MEENNKINEIKENINSLKKEFDKQVILNPYLLFLKQRGVVDKREDEYSYEASKFSKIILFTLLGFGIPAIIIAIYFLFFKNNSDILKAFIQVISVFFTLLVAIKMFLIQETIRENQLELENKYFIIICLIIGLPLLLGSFFSFLKPSIEILAIIPFINYIIVIFLLFYFYKPISSMELRKTIIEKTDSIHEKLDKLNKYFVEDAYSKIEKEIEDLRSIITNNSPHYNCNDLLNKQALNILDLMKLELIINTRNGINLFQNWNFIDSSQNMIREILDENNVNKHITIVGDLSFLCTEKGVTMLIDSIVKGKTFDIYFTGSPKAGDSDVLVSRNCETLLNKISEKISNIDDKTKIKSFLKLLPIKSEFFTGIGFIGLGSKDNNNDDITYEKVYSYISSFITDETKDIESSNPFVFSWNKKTNFFKSFVSNLQCGNLKITINNQDIFYNEILNIL